jgi:preprotein translocase subunit SecF
MFIIKHKNIFILISAVLVIGALVPIILYGLNLGTDFTGGTIVEVTYGQNGPDKAAVAERVKVAGIDTSSIQTAGENGYLIKMKPITEEERVTLLSSLAGTASSSASSSIAAAGTGFQVKRFSSIGPSVGAELARKGIIALVVVCLLIISYIAFAFRHVSRPVSSWKYGLMAVVALIHDVTIPTGVFAYLGHTKGTEVDALFLTALLTILALSVSDTIVVFDRIRENIKNKIAGTFAETVGVSLDETINRSLITSLTVIFVLLVLFFFGSPTTRDFALVLSLGMFFGTYSSIFLASPLLVTAYNRQEAGKLNAKK